MNRSTEKFDHLMQKTNPGYSFTRSERSLKIPASQSYLNDNNLEYHYASNTQKIYSAFQNTYYLPPHLNSSKSYGLIHKGQCKAWKIRNSNSKNERYYGNMKQNQRSKLINGRHICNATTNYDTQYRIYEEKVKCLPKKKYMSIQPRIKYLIDQDRPTKPSKLQYQSEDQDQN